MDQSIFEVIGKPIEIRKGGVLFKQGDIDTSVYVVKSGLLKAYYLTFEGKELVKSFISEGEFIGSLIACKSMEPFSDLQAASTSNPEVSASVINALINLAVKKEKREYEFLCLSAAERYALFKHRTPNLIDRVTQNDIARYLGITPVALSRIKHRKS